MSEWGFLVSRRWAGYLAMVIIFAIACSAFGAWQFNRRAEALAEIARIDANYDAAPEAMVDAVPDLDRFDIDERWQVVGLSGEFLNDDEVVIRNRPGNGTSGFEVVTPFRMDDGRILMIDRGWIAQDSSGRPSTYDAAPSGQTDIEARLKPGEGTISGRTSSGNELATIDLSELSDRVPGEVYTEVYGIEIQDGADATTPPLALDRPERDEGPHLSYALQWFVFAIMGFVGLGWAANRERLGRLEAEADAAPNDRAAANAGPEPHERHADVAVSSRYGTIRAPRSRGQRGGSDADTEDEILDAR